jgi:hypothetical protein
MKTLRVVLGWKRRCGRSNLGEAPCEAAIAAEEVFQQHNASPILVPGCGYGRNSLFLATTSVNDQDYGKGIELDEHTFEYKVGRPMHYYTVESLGLALRNYFRVMSIQEITEYESHRGADYFHKVICTVGTRID